ncbi:hypothetical protein ACFL2T_02185 [Elusimicrobiota bacterium]
MAHTPEKLVEELKDACGPNLKSVVLYGSMAAGDSVAKRSDHNTLVVLERLGVGELKAISGVAGRWAEAGNPAPLLFTWARLKKSGDVFPIELSDIKENHKILFGENPLEDIPIDQGNMRVELEHEMKGKLIQLRERFLLTRGDPQEVRELLIDSLSTFLVLFRAALRLHGERPPASKLEALRALRKHIEFDEEIFRGVHELKAGGKGPGLDPMTMFENFLRGVETVTDAVDEWVHSEKKP